MKRPWISTSLAVALALLVAALPARGALAPDPGGDPAWGAVQTLATRLAEERRKLMGLREEIEKLRFAVEDLRDLQLYPPEITRLRPKEEADLDRLVEALEEGIGGTVRRAGDLERALEDAVFVVQAMAQDSPNRDMAAILMKDNVDRIARYLALNKELSADGGRWDAALAAVRHVRKRSGMSAPAASDGVEDEFFRALRSTFEQDRDRVLGLSGNVTSAGHAESLHISPLESIDLRHRSNGSPV
jgi:hypothetical protein